MPSDLVSLAGGPRKPTSRLYTDADTRKWTAGPGTTYGEWEDTPEGAKQRAAAAAVNDDLDYDPLLEIERANAMIRDHGPAGAQLLMASHGPERARTGLDTVHDVAAALLGEEDTTLGKIRSVARGVALPAGFMAGPVGLAANAYGIADAAASGNVMGAALPAFLMRKTGLGAAAKGANAVRGLFSKAAGGTDEVLQGADMFADAGARAAKPTSWIDRARAKVMGGREGKQPYPGDVTDYNPSDRYMPNTPGNGRAGSVSNAADTVGNAPVVDRYMPNAPSSPRAGFTSAGRQNPTNPRLPEWDVPNQVDPHMPNVPGNASAGDPSAQAMGGLDDVVDRYMPNKPATWGEKHLADLRTADVGPKGPMARPDVDPVTQEFKIADAIREGRASHFPRSVDEEMVDAISPEIRQATKAIQQTPAAREARRGMLSNKKRPDLGSERGLPTDKGVYSPYPRQKGGRQGDMHGAQNDGSLEGFEELPELSEAELVRIQGLFKALGR